MGLKENIKNLRKQQGKTLEDVANFIGITRQTVQKYESGLVTNIPSTTIEKMAEFFNCSPAYLMGWEDAPVLTSEPTRLPDAEVLTISEDEKSLVSDYRKLNTIGKDKAREYVSDLSENEKYTENLSGKLNEKAIG